MNDSSASRIFFHTMRCYLITHGVARRNKSSVTTSMFRDGECTLLSTVPRGDEHYRHSNAVSTLSTSIERYASDASCYARVFPFFFLIFIVFRMVEGKIGSMRARYQFPGACFGLLKQAKYPFLLKLVEKNSLREFLNVLIKLGN